MKQTVLSGVLWFLLFSWQIVKAGPSQQFILKGSIKGLKDGTLLYLVKDAKKDTIARAKAMNGNFLFKGTLTDGTDFFYLRTDTTITKIRSSAFLLVNKALELNGNFNEWPKVNLKGSNAHEDFLTIKNIWTNYKEPERDEKIKAYVRAHTSSLYLPYVILNMKIQPGERTAFYNQLTAEAKNSYFGKLLFENIDLAEKRKQITEGTVIPEFYITTPEDKRVSILEIAAKNKYTLIDFWASWCKPCREEIPNLKKVYAAFKDKGFSIVGVALSDKKDDWKRAIHEDQTTWFHGRDENNKSYKIFNIPAIPGFALIDYKGKLISFACEGSEIKPFGSPIRGEELYKTIENLCNKKPVTTNDTDTFIPLKIGDKVPDVSLGEILNHPTLTSAKISDFKGKLLILDFWFTGCATCIRQFPHLKELQDKFGDRLQILPVGFDAYKEGSIKEFVFKRKGTKDELKLPTTIQKVNDTVLLKLFPQNSQPHEVWINAEGIVIAITDHRAVTTDNIEAVLKGQKLSFKEKKIQRRSFDYIDEVYLLNTGKQKSMVYGSAFTGYSDEFSCVSRGFYPDMDSNYHREYWINYTVFQLYRRAYKNIIPALGDDPYHKRIIIESHNKPFYLDWKDTDKMDNWQYDQFCNNSLFGYEFILPLKTIENEVSQFMIQDLDRHFKIRSRIEKRKVKVIEAGKEVTREQEMLILENMR